MTEHYIPAISSTPRRAASIIVCGVKPAVPAFWCRRRKTPFSDFWSVCSPAGSAALTFLFDESLLPSVVNLTFLYCRPRDTCVCNEESGCLINPVCRGTACRCSHSPGAAGEESPSDRILQSYLRFRCLFARRGIPPGSARAWLYGRN